jgi:hypothetical protein
MDSCRVFHRVQPPATADRYSMTFSYVSVNPYQVFPEYLVSRSALARLSEHFTPRQRSALMID